MEKDANIHERYSAHIMSTTSATGNFQNVVSAEFRASSMHSRDTLTLIASLDIASERNALFSVPRARARAMKKHGIYFYTVPRRRNSTGIFNGARVKFASDARLPES